MLSLFKKFESQSELIDTLWNVNNFGTKKTEDCVPELIDTLWNVNRHNLTGKFRITSN